MRHPKPLFGIAAFGVVFSFVAANALWYQPGDHPHPFLATRDAKDPNAIAGYRPMRRTPPTDVTTFRIERAPTTPAPAVAPAAAPVAAPVMAPAQAPAQVSAPAAEPYPAPMAQPIPATVPAQRPATPSAATQSAPAPAAAPTRPVQQAMPAKPAQQHTAFPPRPAPAAKPASARGDDSIAAAIRASERNPVMLPPADIPNTGSTPRSQPQKLTPPKPTPVAQRPNSVAQRANGGSNTVLQIQRGLSNIAYADVELNGVAGEKTKAAIRRFQKHYRMPETGEADDQVLKKLKSIGAL